MHIYIKHLFLSVIFLLLVTAVCCADNKTQINTSKIRQLSELIESDRHNESYATACIHALKKLSKRDQLAFTPGTNNVKIAESLILMELLKSYPLYSHVSITPSNRAITYFDKESQTQHAIMLGDADEL